MTNDDTIETEAQFANTNRRPDIERTLTDTFNVIFEYVPDVDMSDVDLNLSLQNQARDEPLNDEVVATYAEAMQSGDVFPPVIAWRPGRSTTRQYVLLDGNHRAQAAAKAGIKLDVYEVDSRTKPQVIDLLTFTANVKNGLPPTDDERIRHAVRLLDNGAKVDHAARMVGLSAPRVRAAWTRKKAERRAEDAGVDVRTWEQLPQAQRVAIGQVSTDEGLTGLVKLADKAKLTTEEVKSIVTSLNAHRSGTRQNEQLVDMTEQMRERIQEKGGGAYGGKTGRRSIGPKQHVNMILGKLAILPTPDDLAGFYSQNERDDLKGRAMDAADWFQDLAKACK